MKSVAILLFVCMLVSCTRQNSTKEEFQYIDIKIEQSKNSVNLSDIVDSIDYVSLETNPEYLIGAIDKLIMDDTGNYLIVDKEITKTILRFDPEGKFINKIGCTGQAPNEYVTITDVAYADEKVYVWDCTSRKLLIYSVSGEFISNHKFDYIARSVLYLGNDRLAFCCDYIPNQKLLSDDGYPSVMIYDMKSDEIYPKTFFDKNISSLGYMSLLNNLCDNNLYLPLNDTIYNMTVSGPEVKYVLSYDEKYKRNKEEYIERSKVEKLTADDATESFMKGNYPHLISFFEGDEKCLMFMRMKEMLYYGFFDKRTKEYMEASSESLPVVNDIDGVALFMPRYMDGNVVYSVIDPLYIMMENEALAQKMKLVEDGNPILVKMYMK